MSDVPSRRHLALHLPPAAAAPLDAWRDAWDPVMRAIAPVHVTVTYPEECADEAALLDRARAVSGRLGPVRLRLGALECVDGGRGGVFVAVEDVDGALAELRDDLLLPPQVALDVPFHCTVVHPRTSDRGGACWGELAGARLDLACTVDDLLFTETTPTGRGVLERFGFRGAPAPRPVRVVGLALVREGRVLLGRRSAERASFPGVWDVPGGHVEPGETLRAAARREAREELGVDISVDRPVGRITSAPLGVEMTVFRVDRWEGAVVNAAPEEHDELAWFGPGEWEGKPLVDGSYGTLLADVLRGTRFRLER